MDRKRLSHAVANILGFVFLSSAMANVHAQTWPAAPDQGELYAAAQVHTYSDPRIPGGIPGIAPQPFADPRVPGGFVIPAGTPGVASAAKPKSVTVLEKNVALRLLMTQVGK